jgi:hypothetical protein
MRKINSLFHLKILIIFGFILLLQITQVSGNENIVWQEDFEDEPFDDWIFAGYKYESNYFYYSNITSKIENGRLEMGNASWPYGSGAYHNSSVAYGTWSFDWIVPTELDDKTNVMDRFFLCSNMEIYENGSNSEPPTLNAYFLTLDIRFELTSENPGTFINLGEYNYGIPHTIKEYSDPNPFTGILHIDITRDNDGTFRVHLNSSCEPIFEVVNNRYKTSERVVFWSWRGDSAFDNLVFYNSVEVTTCPKTPAFDVGLLLLVLPLGLIYSRRRRH